MKGQVKTTSALLAAGAIVLGGTAPFATARTETIPRLWKSCANVNKKYPHGVGKAGARDTTSSDPVTNFKRSTRLYRIAMSYNRGLDRDKDGIACEKH